MCFTGRYTEELEGREEKGRERRKGGREGREGEKEGRERRKGGLLTSCVV